ncbi:Vegetative incompatibility protein [Drechslerella dactyloides]|uniref:Vegetative incompatibility protein n=1 Tax=Drechslerella dactyloides TaxID=74499 RepID=A0AAD6IYD7_DREDA|nr:Vegetative incompatibility protein [Drechslerella dactyloides]
MSRPTSFRDPWAVAKDRFMEGLSDKQKEEFRNVTVEEVLYAASAAQKRAQATSKAWYMAAKLMPIVDAIGQYGEALDIVSNTQSGILCPIWGSIRAVLTESVEKEAVLSHMIESSEERKAQADERKLQQAQRELVLRKNLEEEARRKGERWNLIMSRLCPYNYEKKMRQSQSARHKGTCEWVGRCTEYVTWRDATRSTVLWVHGKAGSGKTIISGWVQEDQMRNLQQLKRAILLSYPCDFKEADSLLPTTILQAFIKQMASNLGKADIPDVLLDALAEAVGSWMLEFEEWIELFFKFARNFERIWIILDGIDECDNHNRTEIFRWIAQAASFSDSVIAIYISSRKDIEIKEELGRYPNIPLTTRQPVDDLNNYIAGEVDSLKANGALKFSNQKLYSKVIDQLITKADGMFLWVSLQLRDLCDCATDAEVEETLDELPIGLYETYERALLRTLVEHGTQKRRVWPTSRKVYDWLYHALRPLTLDELMEAIAVDIEDQNLDFTKVATGNERWKIIKRCGNLLEYNEADQTVTFFHYTLKQYITELSNHDQGQDAPWDHKLIATARCICSSNQCIADVCLTYLLFSDFETALVPFKQSGLNSNMEHILQCTSNLAAPTSYGNTISRGVQSILRGFRLMNGLFEGERPDYKIDFAKYIYHPKLPPESILVRYKLLNYVQSFWLQHCRDFDRSVLPSYVQRYQKFARLCFEREFLFDVRPWGKRYSRGQHPYTDAFIWGVENDHHALLWVICGKTTLEDRIWYNNLRLPDGSTPAIIAASHSTPTTLRFLLSTDWTSDSAPISISALNSVQDFFHKRNLLHVAVIHGSLQVAEFLLSSMKASSWMNKDTFENTPLDYAIDRDDYSIIRLFIQKGLGNMETPFIAFSSPGWSLDGTSSWKIEKLFLLVCSHPLPEYDIYQAFKRLLWQWIQNVSPNDNEYLLQGIKSALGKRSLDLLLDLYERSYITKTPQLGPQMQNLLHQVFQLAVTLEDSPAISILLHKHHSIFISPQEQFLKMCEKSPVNYRELSFFTQFLPFPAAIPRLLALLYGVPTSSEILLMTPQEGNFKDTRLDWLTGAFTDFKYSTFKTALDQELLNNGRLSAAAIRFFWQNVIVALHICNFRRDISSMRDLVDMADAMLSYSLWDLRILDRRDENSWILLEILQMVDHIWYKQTQIRDLPGQTIAPSAIRQLSILIFLLQRLVSSLPPKKKEHLFLAVKEPISVLGCLPRYTIPANSMVQLLLTCPIKHIQKRKLYENAEIGANTIEDHPLFEIIHLSDKTLTQTVTNAELPDDYINTLNISARSFGYLSLWAPGYLEALLMESVKKGVYSTQGYQYVKFEDIQYGLSLACNLFSNMGSPPRLSNNQFASIYYSIKVLLAAGADPTLARSLPSLSSNVISPYYEVKLVLQLASNRKVQAQKILNLFENIAEIQSDTGRDLDFWRSSADSNPIWSRRMAVMESLEQGADH